MGFWHGRKTLVTGGAGFLGSFVVERLKGLGCKDVFVPRSSDYDLIDMGAVKRLYRDASPEVVIHLAARVGGIGANRKNPGKFFYDNLMMGAQMIEAACAARVEKFALVGTICSYPKHARVPFCEEDLWNGYPEETNAPYGIAKKALFVQAAAYREQYGLNSICLLPVNLYGPRDNFNLETSHVIPALIRKCVEAVREGKGSITLWGTGTPTREFLYVEDAAEAVITAVEKLNDPAPVNIGTGEEISIKELATLVAGLTGFKGEFVWDAAMPDGQPRRMLDTSKARRLFGFEARTKLNQGLKTTIEWYVRNQSA